MNAHQIFEFAAPVASLVQHSHGNLTSFNQGSSQVDSFDLVDIFHNKDIWALGQTEINVPTLKSF